jgi:hypothetical protein
MIPQNTFALNPPFSFPIACLRGLIGFSSEKLHSLRGVSSTLRSVGQLYVNLNREIYVMVSLATMDDDLYSWDNYLSYKGYEFEG